MTQDELMTLAAEKAVKELSWESIEFLFRPQTQLELFLRLDFEGMKQKINEWWADDSPDAMPFRFRAEPGRLMDAAVKREEFYRKVKELTHG